MTFTTEVSLMHTYGRFRRPMTPRGALGLILGACLGVWSFLAIVALMVFR